MALRTIDIPTRNYTQGSSSIAASSIVAGAKTLEISLDVTNWTNKLTVIDIAMEFSLDNQATWQPGGRAPLQSRADGTFRDYRGNILTVVKAKFSWPEGVTHARGNVSINGSNVRTGGTVEIS
jgi:hypothetical protein